MTYKTLKHTNLKKTIIIGVYIKTIIGDSLKQMSIRKINFSPTNIKKSLQGTEYMSGHIAISKIQI